MSLTDFNRNDWVKQEKKNKSNCGIKKLYGKDLFLKKQEILQKKLRKLGLRLKTEKNQKNEII